MKKSFITSRGDYNYCIIKCIMQQVLIAVYTTMLIWKHISFFACVSQCTNSLRTKTEIFEFVNRVDPDEAAYNEPPHPDLCCCSIDFE